MKRIVLSTIGIALVLLAGCVVNSVYPFYTAKDLTFDPALLGVWSDPEETNTSQETWTFEQLGAQTYKLTIRDGSGTNEFDTHLFTLGGQKFLDSLPRSRAEYHTPSHFLLRVKSSVPALELQLLNYEWLKELVEKKPKTIRHIIVPDQAGDSQDKGTLTLAADTAELQKFILKNLNNTNAWVDPMVMKKQ